MSSFLYIGPLHVTSDSDIWYASTFNVRFGDFSWRQIQKITRTFSLLIDDKQFIFRGFSHSLLYNHARRTYHPSSPFSSITYVDSNRKALKNSHEHYHHSFFFINFKWFVSFFHNNKKKYNCSDSKESHVSTIKDIFCEYKNNTYEIIRDSR